MKYFSIILLMSILFTACGDEDVNEECKLNFKLEYQDQPLVMFKELTYPDNNKIEFTRISFYISEIDIKVDGVNFNAGERYLDLTISHADENSASQGLDVFLTGVEGNNIESLAFNLGLTAEQNATVPQDYPSSSDLSKSGEYWSNWNSYVFVKLEGRLDRDGDGIKEAFALHLGSDAAMRSVEFNNLNDDHIVAIKIDVEKIFNTGTLYNIAETPNIHTLDQLDKINQLMDNFENSMNGE